ncbi:MAG: NAD(P)H-dependent oxidoreductase [Candidatus Paceibacterota bacterium]
MPEQKLFIPIILGTVRKDSASSHVAKWLHEKMSAYPEIETKLIDPKNFNFSTDDYGPAVKDNFADYRDAIIKADGIVIVMPEYNHGYPAPLKWLLDSMFDEYKHKAVGMVACGGFSSGTRVIENLIPVLRELKLTTIEADLNFSRVGELFDESGNLKDPASVEKRYNNFISELLWMSKTLRWGRENVKS